MMSIMIMIIIQVLVRSVLKENSVLKKIGLTDINGLINAKTNMKPIFVCAKLDFL